MKVATNPFLILKLSRFFIQSVYLLFLRSMGNLKEAEAIEAQMKMKGVNHYYNFNGNEQPYGAR